MLATQSKRPTLSATVQLKPFQAEDVAKLRDHDYRALVANAPGTGKTVEMLACIALDREKLTPALIIAPSSVLVNWWREAKKWLRDIRVHVITDTTTPLPFIPADITVVSWGLLTTRFMEIAKIQPKFIIADEAHFAKDPDAQRTQALRALAKRSPHMILLSGTPLVNKESELETIKSLFHQPEVPMIRRLLEDVCPEIPPKTRATLPIVLRPEHAKQYEHAETEFAEWLEKELTRRMTAGEARAAAERALAAEALVKTGYLRRLLGEAKVFAASDWIARAVRIGEPVVVFCEHQDVVAKLEKALKQQRIGHAIVDGSASRKDRQDAIDQFQAGKIPVFIGTKAAKEGITLTRARHLLFLERYWTSAEEEQAEDRIRRITQTRPTTIWFLHAVDTIDDRIAEVIEYKRKIVDKVIGSAEIAEKDEDGVLDMISNWTNRSTSLFAGKETDLGLGKQLPAIPHPFLTCSLTFKGAKWDSRTARNWATLHGYNSTRMETGSGIVVVRANDPSKFVHGSFKSVTITDDIKAVIGDRKDRRKLRFSS